MFRYTTTTSLFVSVLCLYFSDTAALVAPLPLAATVVIEAPITKTIPTTTPIIPTRTQPDEKRTTRRSHDSNQNRREEEDLWEVKVYNDNINTHEWVARCLVVVASQSEWQAYQTTKLAHLHGEACLGVWEQELAQRYVDGLRMEGIVVDMFPIQDFQ